MPSLLLRLVLRIVLRPVLQIVAVGTLALSLAACDNAADNPSANIQPTEKTPSAALGEWGIETQYIATDITPGDDFYRYVNKGWLDTAKIPTGLPRTGAFIELALRTEDQLANIIADVTKGTFEKGTSEQKIADLYLSYINMEQRNALGMSMLEADLTATLASESKDDIARRMGMIGYSSIVDAGVLRDPENPERYTLMIGQSGLGMPGRGYYLIQEAPYGEFRTAYRDYIENVLTRAKVPNPSEKADAIMAFELALAAIHWPPEKTRKPLLNNHRVTMQELTAYAPGFNWKEFFTAAGFDNTDSLVVASDEAIKASAALFAETPLETLRAYTAFHFLNNAAPYLSADWYDAHFDVFSRKLSGIKEPRPLKTRALNLLNTVLGEQLGKLYVERYFPESAKKQMVELVDFLRLSFHQRLEQVEWMGDETRDAAFEKLDSFTSKIGYPDKWQDFSDIHISKDNLVGNLYSVMTWQQQDAVAKLNEPARDWEWSMSPQTVNAYYSPTSNEIVFPAAILQPPFFDENADPAVNFGAIGMVIGHELSHGFDDQGSRYDSTGTLRNWWTPTARAQFDQRSDQLVAQFNEYEPLEGLHVNGKLTLGENIGDLGGTAVSYNAYQNDAAKHYPNGVPVIDGFSGNQRFFMSFAQLWRTLTTPSRVRQEVLTNPHSPGEYRVNGILKNFTPWYDAFDVQVDNALYLKPEERIRIW